MHEMGYLLGFSRGRERQLAGMLPVLSGWAW